MEVNDELRAKLDSLPRKPGVYRYLDSDGKTLYVGKAKSLRSRVRSYFGQAAKHAPHIDRMLADVVDLDIIVVDTEMEALILEANLIKRERPPYNVILRDDKNFPFPPISRLAPTATLPASRQSRAAPQVVVRKPPSEAGAPVHLLRDFRPLWHEASLPAYRRR